MGRFHHFAFASQLLLATLLLIDAISVPTKQGVSQERFSSSPYTSTTAPRTGPHRLPVASPTNKITTVDWESYNEREHEGPGTYAFGYDVQDTETSNVQFREESRGADGAVRGSYGLVEPDGNVRIVHYVADHLGFRVEIENSQKPSERHPQPASPTIPTLPPRSFISREPEVSEKRTHAVEFADSHQAYTSHSPTVVVLPPHSHGVARAFSPDSSTNFLDQTKNYLEPRAFQGEPSFVSLSSPEQSPIYVINPERDHLLEPYAGLGDYRELHDALRQYQHLQRSRPSNYNLPYTPQQHLGLY